MINNDVNCINWNLDLDNDMEGFLMEACSDSPDVVLVALRWVILPLCPLTAVPKWPCYRIVTLFFPCFRSYVYGLRHGLSYIPIISVFLFRDLSLAFLRSPSFHNLGCKGLGGNAGPLLCHYRFEFKARQCYFKLHTKN